MKNNVLDLIDFDKVNLLLESFNKLTGFVTAILDLEGNVLSKSGWRKICTEFHRVHPGTAKRCTESDTKLAGEMAAGEKYHFYKCLNGLVDVAVPIIVNEEHVANLFSGQFFFEKPDRDFFKKQAAKYKFNNDKYIEALDKVPIVSEEEVKIAMDFLLNMTQVISEMTLQRLEQIELNNVLRKTEERWQFAIEGNKDGLWDWNIETNEVFLSRQWKAMLGFEDHEIEDKLEERDKRVHPDDKEKMVQYIQKHIDNKTDVYVNEHRMLCKNGTYKWILDRGKVVSRDEEGRALRFIGTYTDMTDRKKAEKLLYKSEARFRKMFNNATFGIIICQLIRNKKGKAIDYIHFQVNDAMKKHLGVEPKDLLGKKCSEIVSKEELAYFVKNFGEVVETGNPFEYEKFFPVFGGRTIDNRSFFLEDDFFAVIFFDVTEKRQAEAELLKHKEHLEDLVNERTKELEEKYLELERMNKLFVGRELRMKELKDIITELKNKPNN